MPTYIHIHEDAKRLQKNAKRLECKMPKDITNITLTVPTSINLLSWKFKHVDWSTNVCGTSLDGLHRPDSGHLDPDVCKRFDSPRWCLSKEEVLCWAILLTTQGEALRASPRRILKLSHMSEHCCPDRGSHLMQDYIGPPSGLDVLFLANPRQTWVAL